MSEFEVLSDAVTVLSDAVTMLTQMGVAIVEEHPLVQLCRAARFGLSESYLAVKGAALILPQSECTRKVTRGSHGGDIQNHLQSMFYLLRPQDTIKVAVKLESAYPCRNRYMAVVSTNGRQDTEESIILGIDCNDGATIGLVLPVWGDLAIRLDGDGGFSISSNDQEHIFKPVSVQAMWSALQSVIKVRDVANQHSYYPGGLTHTWMSYYEVHISSDQTSINEWHAMEDIESHRPESPSVLGEPAEKVDLENRMKTRLKEIMMTVDLEEVTSKYLRMQLEEEMGMNLKEYRHFIDEETIVILRQMDSPSMIFDHLYLGSEWNASNLEELRENGIGYILNITREIDNFFPGIFEYYNIRVWDMEKSELLKYWDHTYKFIAKAKEMGSKVLVHCKMGISRSASTVMAYAMKEYGWSLDEAYKYVKEKRSCVRPNEGFMHQLTTYQGILDASKQRHNTLWRSKSENNLDNSLQVKEDKDEEAFAELDFIEPGDTSSGRPRSWSPDDTTTELLLKSKDLAPSQQRYICRLPDEGIKDLDDTGPILFHIDNWDEIDISSRSADSMDDVFPDEPTPDSSPPGGYSGPVTLLGYRPYEESDSDSGDDECGFREIVTEESDLEEFAMPEQPRRVEFGFYDVNMLTPESHEELQEGGGSRVALRTMYNYREFAHPDMKMEYLMSQQKRHKHICKMLMRSDHTPKGAKSQEEPPSRLLIEGSKATPVAAKVRPDSSWIKETPPSPAQESVDKTSTSESAEQIVESTSNTTQPTPATDVVPDQEETQESSSLAQSSDEAGPTPLAVDGTKKQPEISVPQHYEKEEIPWKTGTVKKQTKDLEQRIKTELTLKEIQEKVCRTSTSSGSGSGSVGSSVEKLLEDLMGDTEEPLEDPHAEASPLLSPVGGADSGVEMPDAAKTAQDISASRPLSIYETEAIELEPGIVQRTKLEIEERERSSSFSKLLTDSEGRPVQRSASLKSERVSPRKDRNSERRKTCLPVLRPTSSKEPVPQVEKSKRASSVGHDARPVDTLLQVPQRALFQEFKNGEDRGEKEADTAQAGKGGDVAVLHIGTDQVPIHPGIVKKQTKDFETRYVEPEAKEKEPEPKEVEPTVKDAQEEPSGEDIPAETPGGQGAHDRTEEQKESADSGGIAVTQPETSTETTYIQEGIEIVCGSVRKQTKELEQKYGSVDTDSVKRGPSPRPGSGEKDGAKRGPSPRPGSGDRDKLVGSPTSETHSGDFRASRSEISTKGKVESTTSPGDIPQPQIHDGLSKVSCCPPTDQGVHTTSTTMKIDSDRDSTSSCSDLAGENVEQPLSADSVKSTHSSKSAYEDEDIPWSVGTVKQHKAAIESKAKEYLASSPPKQGRPLAEEASSPEKKISRENLHMSLESCGEEKQLKSSSTHKECVISPGQASQGVVSPLTSQKLVIIERGKSPGGTSECQPKGGVSEQSPPSNDKVTKPSFPDSQVSVTEANRERDDQDGSTASPKVICKHESIELRSPGDEIKVRDMLGLFESRETNTAGEALESDRPVGVLKKISTPTKDKDRKISESHSSSALDRASSSSVVAKDAKGGGKPADLHSVDTSEETEHTVRLRSYSGLVPDVLSRQSETVKAGLPRRVSTTDLAQHQEGSSEGMKVSHSMQDVKGYYSAMQRIPISPLREPDPSLVPRKTRKLQGKTHPLSKLTPEGRSSKPFYNTM